MGSRFPGSKKENIGHFFQDQRVQCRSLPTGGSVELRQLLFSLSFSLVLLFITAWKTSLFFLSSHLLPYLVATNRQILRRVSVVWPLPLFIHSPLNCHPSVASRRCFPDMKSCHSSILPLFFSFFFFLPHLFSFPLLFSCPSSSRNNRGVSLSRFFSSPLISCTLLFFFPSPPVFFFLSFPGCSNTKSFHRLFLSFYTTYFLSCRAPSFHLSSSILLSSHARCGNCRGGRFLGSVLSSTPFSFKRHLHFCSIDL